MAQRGLDFILDCEFRMALTQNRNCPNLAVMPGVYKPNIKASAVIFGLMLLAAAAYAIVHYLRQP